MLCAVLGSECGRICKDTSWIMRLKDTADDDFATWLLVHCIFNAPGLPHMHISALKLKAIRELS